jgi:two-component system sensor histidine kinase AtoS
MKKKIVISLVTFAILSSLGGIYFITAVQNSAESLYSLIRMHQVEILREHLVIQIRTVQSELQARGNTKMLSAHVGKAEAVMESCFGCHHTGDVQATLVELRSRLREYGGSVGKSILARTKGQGPTEEEKVAYGLGEGLIRQMDAMIVMTGGNLEMKTKVAVREIGQTKQTLFLLVAAGLILAAGLAVILVRSFTRPLHILLGATRRLKAGELDYRIEGLKDEFREVAASFNEMALSLKDQMHRNEQSRQDWEETFNAISDMIIIRDADFELVRANREAATLLGISESNGTAKCFKYFQDAGPSPEDCRICGCVKPMEPGSFEVFEPSINRFFEVRAMPRSRNGNGKGNAGMIHVIRDITERKRTEDAMQRAEQMRVVGEIAAGLAHEIKIPLTGIMMAMETVAADAELRERDRDALRRAATEAKRIQTLVRDLLNFAKPPKPQMIVVDINNLLDSTLSFSFNKGSNSAVPIEVKRVFDLSSPSVLADPMQMKQVFLNLFVNAADAMSEGGKLIVKSVSEERAGIVSIEVADTGKGIKEESLDKIFQPFFTTKAKGSGLGLAVTKRLVEQHGGAIGVSSVVGAGTVFTVRLPLAGVLNSSMSLRHEVDVIAG